MPVDDTWYLSKPDDDGKRRRSAKYGRGKRWRCRYEDAVGEPRERMFKLKDDAEHFDAKATLGIVDDVPARRTRTGVSFRDYAERWRLSRESGWVAGTRRRIESNLRNQIYPVFGDHDLPSITPTSVLEWITSFLADDVPQSSIKLYFELIDTIMTAALADKQRADNPCDGIRLSKILRGVSREPLWVPNENEVTRLLRAVPARYRAALYLGAGQGLRLGEALGMEAGERCVDADAGDLHVVQQMQYSVKEYGGHYLCEPKAGSSGTIDLDPLVAEHLALHVEKFPPVEVDLIDITSGRPIRRIVPLLFTTTHGNPINDKTWSREWTKWRAVAGWPTEHSGFHALRHFLATTLIKNHAEPKEVQWMLRHKTLRITMETYVSWWPKRDRKRGLVGSVLAAAAEDYQRRDSR